MMIFLFIPIPKPPLLPPLASKWHLNFFWNYPENSLKPV
jgi:hypothetical protein